MTMPPDLDRITVTGIEAYGYHGVLPHEREHGQRFVVDVVLALDLSPAGETGDLAASVHYGTLSERVADAIASDPVDLIETLALRILRICFGFEPVRWASVTVHKPDAPIAVTFSDVAVTIERSRT
ncbi:dihydroneopterin aldolase [Mumia sp. zg.B53]|uniref:dihydroneopterin aldolase n=1 Tax=unclassified Mumia TaxID=2621872 RepID=UPI001C6F03D6|nr:MULTISPECIES: dihydroneopterin aldolase [unclassified Mumia]MBW9209540.1 dihydroneopterin aldolase [Mumia sp. zg.B21]MBW9214145.1 dihydroneopterin aldolase [Mumia sp. zg.B53]MDD9348802.1 dihydroneopterin aldolase [Mumia sp.]